MTKYPHRVLLLNCARKNEPDDTLFLSEFFRTIQEYDSELIEYERKQIKRKNDFINTISENWASIIHVSAHGDSPKSSGVKGRRGKKTHIKIGRSKIMSKDIEKIGIIDAEIVFSSACLTSYEDLAARALP